MPTFIKATRLFRALRYLLRKVRETWRCALWNTDVVPSYKRNYRKLEAMRNRHAGQPCVVIGGGPSINKMDLNKLKDFVTIACNGFYLKHDSINFIPTYYTVEDPLPAWDNREEISGLKGTTKIIPYDLRHVIREDDNTIYINFRRSYARPSSPGFPYYTKDFLQQSFWGGTVLYMNIQLAHYLGCNPIYLIGVDLTYEIPSSVKQSGAVLTSTEDDINHFDPRYFGAGKRWHLPETERMQMAFSKAYQELSQLNLRLVNAGIDSKLHTVPKEKII